MNSNCAEYASDVQLPKDNKTSIKKIGSVVTSEFVDKIRTLTKEILETNSSVLARVTSSGGYILSKCELQNMVSFLKFNKSY